MIRSSRLLPGLLMAAAMIAVPAIAPSAAFAADEAAAESIGDVVAEKYAALLERDYVYPETGKRYAAALRAGIKAGQYRTLSGPALGEAIDKDVSAVSPDGHLRVRAPDAAAAAVAPTPGAAAPVRRAPKVPVEQAGWIAPGIAFIRLNLFPDDAAVTEAAAKFMADHADA